MAKFALFGSGAVGLRAAEVIAKTGDEGYVVLDPTDRDGVNASIAEIARGTDAVFAYDDFLSAVSDGTSDLGVDIGILAWWPHIIPIPVIDLAKWGFINFHPSLLPYNRGKDPNFWALKDATPFGVTLHFVAPGVDNGDIAFQQQIPVTWEDTAQTLYERSLTAIVELFEEAWPRIRTGDIPRVPQDESIASFHRRDELDPASEIQLKKQYEARELLDLLRARTFPPYPAAYFDEDGHRYEVRVAIRRVT